jgi:ABC-2 type transport system permease protein
MLAVFKRDFRAYFTSAIGYIYIGSYILVLNFSFYLSNALGNSASIAGVFDFMLMVMMFLTPILTMRVFSEEFKQRTDQLLFTSPIKVTGIVLGKYMSALMVFVCLLFLTLLWPLTISVLGKNNMAEVLGNYVGILAIGSAYIAIGVFISSLTENQVVAAVGSLGLFIFLYLLESLATFFFSRGVLPEFLLRSILFTSISARYKPITWGILELHNIVFFFSLTALFVFFTVLSLEKRRKV